ncbi:hypothetical protein QEH52_11510 [Coraliomargarita sp. SDUM461003]|uniref:DUF3352 domain-containing protein n=1 Tax=Thalassobacterium maritimum TaxID=3041265 RepID=A0ABU1AVF7_9BACT|nr:DUF3352 domain-containing protein [Coraliomargarita sp. SDUM461003]MDQ8208139.1 hypothetical protein [Coraliomargarita sp. SDUM461003]
MHIHSYRTTFLSAACAACAASLSLPLSLSAASFNQMTEADVDVYISIRNIEELRDQWAAHSFAEVVEDPSLQEFLQPLLHGGEASESEDAEESMTEVLEHEFGLSWDELYALFPGQLSMAWFNVPELLLQQAERPDIMVLAEYTGDVDQLDTLMQVQFERNAKSQQALNPAIEHTMIEETFMGETLYFDETYDGEQTYIEDGYALVDGVFILATPEERLRSAVEAIKDGPDAPLGEQAAYLRAREEGGRGDLELYFNLEALMPPLNEALLDKLLQGGALMLGLNADSLNNMFALESMQAAFMDVDLVDEGLEVHSGLIYHEQAGLLRLLAYTDEPLPEARYVPNGVFSTSITNLDVGDLLAQFETLLTTASPNLRAQFDAQLQMVHSNTGVDFRSAILENFADDVVSLSVMPETSREAGAIAEPDQVFVVGLENAASLSSALEALIDLVPGAREQIQTQDFAGQTIYSFKNAAAANAGVSYVITRSKFILSIGQLGLLQEVLTRLESGVDGFWQDAETEAIFESIARPDAVARSYVDIEKMFLPIFQSIVQASQLASGGSSLDLEQLPQKLAKPFYMITETNQADDGLFNRSFIRAREDSK